MNLREVKIFGEKFGKIRRNLFWKPSALISLWELEGDSIGLERFWFILIHIIPFSCCQLFFVVYAEFTHFLSIPNLRVEVIFVLYHIIPNLGVGVISILYNVLYVLLKYIIPNPGVLLLGSSSLASHLLKPTWKVDSVVVLSFYGFFWCFFFLSLFVSMDKTHN